MPKFQSDRVSIRMRPKIFFSFSSSSLFLFLKYLILTLSPQHMFPLLKYLILMFSPQHNASLVCDIDYQFNRMQADGFQNSPFGKNGDSDSERSLKLNDRYRTWHLSNIFSFRKWLQWHCLFTSHNVFLARSFSCYCAFVNFIKFAQSITDIYTLFNFFLKGFKVTLLLNLVFIVRPKSKI